MTLHWTRLWIFRQEVTKRSISFSCHTLLLWRNANHYLDLGRATMMLYYWTLLLPQREPSQVRGGFSCVSCIVTQSQRQRSSMNNSTLYIPTRTPQTCQTRDPAPTQRCQASEWHRKHQSDTERSLYPSEKCQGQQSYRPRRNSSQAITWPCRTASTDTDVYISNIVRCRTDPRWLATGEHCSNI